MVVACASVSVGLAIFTLVGLGRISWQEGLAGCALLVAPGLSAIRRKPRKRGTLPLTPIAVLALGTIGSVLGCSSPTAARARNALDVAAYTASLEACKDEGVRERSYARYEACAERADRTFGRRGGAR